MVSYANREEKGSYVNVAAHLLLDVLRAARSTEPSSSPVTATCGSLSRRRACASR
jgi:hypothetical protein